MNILLESLVYAFSYISLDKAIRALKHFNNMIISQKYKRKFRLAGNGLYLKKIGKIIGTDCIIIGNQFKARENIRLEAIKDYRGVKFNPLISIGDNVNMGIDCHIGAINSIKIGDNVLMGNRVIITDHNHGNSSYDELETFAVERKLFSKGGVEIGNNVWIGDGVAILPGVVIGENSVIGVNSVVTKNIPPNSIVAGVPAKVIKVVKEKL